MFKGKTQHKTFVGGSISILLLITILGFFQWRLNLMAARDRNLLMSTNYFRDLESEEPMKLKNGEFKIWASFTNSTYDNDDNEYA